MTQWLAKLLIVLSIAVSCEALAAVESVPPEQKWAVSSGVGALLNISFYQPSKPEACLFFFNNFVINSPYPPHSYIGDDGTNCNWTNKFGGQISNYLLATACPVPKVNPDVPYTYLPATNTCERELIYKLKLTPDSATIEPGQSYEFTATVTTLDDKQPSISVSVSVKVEAGASNGGAPPQGEVSPAIGSNTFPIKFTSTQGSGIHTITATCGLCENGPQTVKVIVKAGCPEHASGSPCACDEGYKFNKENTQCVCFIDPLPDIGKDKCTQALESGSSATIQRDCPPLNKKLTDPPNGQIQCLADKIHALGIAYNGPTATIRTEAYQKHFVEVWAKWVEIRDAALSDAQKLACADVIANVKREKEEIHGLDSPPSTKGNNAPHVLGNAIDISRSVAAALKVRATTTTRAPIFRGCIACTFVTITNGVQDYVNSAVVNPPACKLKWGGTFIPVDDVHFQLQQP
ncbi:MAG: hypothetical protein PHQ60_02790 [Sideroxydans sp.]|nr:hypothetical protein [Sideroxydans sp.]